MKRQAILTLFGLLLFTSTFGQDKEKYSALVKEADSFYENKEYLKSGQKYSEAFAILDNFGNIYDRYNAACSWAMANEIDSSFFQLFLIAQKGNFKNYGHIIIDTDLTILHSDQRWNTFVNLVKENKERAEANLDKTLVATLDTIFQEDQGLRIQIDEVEKKYGRNSDEIKAHWKTIMEKDSLNLIKIQKILDEYGWLGPDIIGDQGNLTLFLVIQHADLETQEKYLPMMREAVSKGNANASNLALLEDRIALRKGGKQIYGSQIGMIQESGEFYVLPLVDPDNVNKRRSEVGLGSIQDYISMWGMTWNVEEYKKKLPEYEARQKK